MFTILCKFSHSTGWRVFKVVNIETDAIAVLSLEGLRLLAIPVVASNVRQGAFCNPTKLVMQAVRDYKAPVKLSSNTMRRRLLGELDKNRKPGDPVYVFVLPMFSSYIEAVVHVKKWRTLNECKPK